MSKPKCKYWASCFRKNPDHLLRFRHPSDIDAELQESDSNEKEKKPHNLPISQPKMKKRKPLDLKPVIQSSDSELESENEIQISKKRKLTRNVNADSKLGKETRRSKVKSRSDDDDDDDHKLNDCNAKQAPTKLKTLPPLPKLSKIRRNAEWQKYFLSCYNLEMPQDLFDFWDFAVEMSAQEGQEDVCLLLEEILGLTLVGPFEILAGKFVDKQIQSMHLHWRYYFDPPEFMTILNDESSGVHYGYFRDDPEDLPSFVAKISGSNDSVISAVGDNLFCAISKICESRLKSKNFDQKNENINWIKKFQAELKKYGGNSTKKDPLSNFKKRKKSVVAPTFNKIGIVVPVDELNEEVYGYRPLPSSDGELKKTLKRMNKEKESGEDVNGKQLDRILNLITYADDEGDPGMGFELGVDLFCSHKMFEDEAFRLLSNTYRFLNRKGFVDILSVHFQNRNRPSLSQLQLK